MAFVCIEMDTAQFFERTLGVKLVEPKYGPTSFSESKSSRDRLTRILILKMKWGYISVLQARLRACAPVTCVHFTKNQGIQELV